MSTAHESAPRRGELASTGPTTITTDEAGWWEQARILLLSEVLDARVERHLDVGCGRGDIASRIAASGTLVVAVDAHRYPEWSDARGVAYVLADVENLPFRPGAFPRASALDVIEHLADDKGVLAELARVGAAGGEVIVTVPADPRLWSVHDERVGHFRRYRRATLLAAAAGVGLAPKRITYFFTWLYPVAFALRKSRGELTGNEGGGATTRLAGILCRAERWWLRRGRLPFGTSLLLTAAVDSGSEASGDA